MLPAAVTARRPAGKAVPEVTTFTPGEDAALEALSGKDGFATARLKAYNTDRNNPNKPKVRCLDSLSRGSIPAGRPPWAAGVYL